MQQIKYKYYIEIQDYKTTKTVHFPNIDFLGGNMRIWSEEAYFAPLVISIISSAGLMRRAIAGMPELVEMQKEA